eukprot:1193764-Prorocentrum_minimum.AAC.2
MDNQVRVLSRFSCFLTERVVRGVPTVTTTAEVGRTQYATNRSCCTGRRRIRVGHGAARGVSRRFGGDSVQPSLRL